LCSAFVAELWGVYEGLKLVYRLGFKNVELEVDSEAVVGVIKSGCTMSYGGSTLLKRIWKLLEKDWKVEISHVYREANNCADALANIGCSHVFNFEFYDCCPSSLSDVFNLDMRGNTTSRLVCL
jgi:ribonuclease HI